jgi:hypothetical protein
MKIEDLELPDEPEFSDAEPETGVRRKAGRPPSKSHNPSFTAFAPAPKPFVPEWATRPELLPKRPPGR